MKDKFAFIDEQLESLKKAGLYRNLKILSGPQEARCIINGRKMINLSSNNYLGLANHPKLKKAAYEAIDKYGLGTAAVRSIIGTTDLHEKLEKKLAEFKHVEAVLTFQSGLTANHSVLGTILSENDLVVSDELNHGSIIDGIKLTKCKKAIYKHSDMEELKEILFDVRKKGKLGKEEINKESKILIATDGVFSMDGDIAPLPAIYKLAQKYQAIVMVDDAHGSGVLGDGGRGTVNHFKLDGQWDIQMATLSKAFGVIGGYIAGTLGLRKLMEHKARPFLFSTSLPAVVVAASLAAIEILESDEGKKLVNRLWDNTKFFKKELTRLGFDTGISQTPITPIMVGQETLAVELSNEVFENGVFGQAIYYPTVARSKARIRTIVTASHTKKNLEKALEVFQEAGKKLGII